MSEFLQKHIYKIFQSIIFFIFLTPILAPILNHFGLNAVSGVIYWAYSYSCHQLAHRSLYIYDDQCAWCARDTFIWGGISLATILVPALNIKKFKIIWLIPFVIPIALDGGIQTIATMLGVAGGDNFYTSTNLMRAFTGGIFGLGIGMFLATMIRSAYFPDLSKIDMVQNNKNIFKLVIIGFLTLSIFYVGMIGLWSATSEENKPEMYLDHVVKTPADETAWIRQIDGACDPEEPKNILEGSSPTSSMFSLSDCL
jgi:uncharacterized membrane protein